MSATRIWSKFKELLDVSWGSVSDGYLLKRSGTNIIGVPASSVGQVWRGEYNPATTYQPNDAVSYTGSSYLCGATTTGVAPVPSTASYLIPPLATTGSMGSIAVLPAANQDQYFARGDNTWQLLSTVAKLPTNHLSGFTLSNNATDATNDLNIIVGKCRDATDSVDIVLNTPLVKQLDAVWAAGTNAGMRDTTTGAITDQWYHVWVIYNATTGAVDVWCSVAANLASPVLPSGYTHRRRIGAIQRSAGVIRQFRHLGDHVQWITPIFEANDVQQVTGQAGMIAASVPTGMKFMANFTWKGYAASGPAIWTMRDPDCDGSGAMTNLASAVANTGACAQGVCWTNASNAIAYNVINSNGILHFYSSTLSYWDPRGRDSAYVC